MPARPPAEADLRDTLDLLGRVVADISDRVDRQTEEIQRLRAAQPNPENLAVLTDLAVRSRLEPLMHRLLDAVSELTGDKAKLRLRLRALRAERWLKGQSWWQTGRGRALLLGAALVAMFVLALALPRVLGAHEATCGLMGGVWSEGLLTDRNACTLWSPSTAKADAS